MEYPAHSGYNFPGKIVLVTGSGRSSDRFIAFRYAESGVAYIIPCSRTASGVDEAEQNIKKINAHVKVYKYFGDITGEEHAVAMAKAVRKEEGRLNALINSAGMTNDWDSIIEGDTEMWLKCWDLHIKAMYLRFKSFLPLLAETAKNQDVTVDVINTTSVAAHFAIPGA